MASVGCFWYQHMNIWSTILVHAYYFYSPFRKKVIEWKKISGMFDGLSMYDIMIWFFRMSVPILIYRIYFMDRTVLRHYPHRSCGPVLQSSFPASGKQHFTISSNRPLFEIRESNDLIAGTPAQPPINDSSSVSRDILIGFYLNSSESIHVRELFAVKPPSGLASHESTESDITPAQEKLYLQSLVQFRALRSSGLNHATWEQWNEEARRILNGVNLVRCTGVATEVFETILSVGVLPDCETFTLLVRTSVKLGEFEAAKTFLNEMTNAGFLPSRTLVDDVSKGLCASSCITGSTFNRDAPEFVPSMTKFPYAEVPSSASIRE